MAMRTRSELTVQHPDAAGIDIGGKSHFVAVPPGRGDTPVREFGCFTEDLHAMAAWLLALGITIVALESTGVYWVPVFEVPGPTASPSCWSTHTASGTCRGASRTCWTASGCSS